MPVWDSFETEHSTVEIGNAISTDSNFDFRINLLGNLKLVFLSACDSKAQEGLWRSIQRAKTTVSYPKPTGDFIAKYFVTRFFHYAIEQSFSVGAAFDTAVFEVNEGLSWFLSNAPWLLAMIAIGFAISAIFAAIISAGVAAPIALFLIFIAAAIIAGIADDRYNWDAPPVLSAAQNVDPYILFLI